MLSVEVGSAKVIAMGLGRSEGSKDVKGREKSRVLIQNKSMAGSMVAILYLWCEGRITETCGVRLEGP